MIAPIGPLTGRPSDWRITIQGEGSQPEETVLKLINNHQGGQSDSGGSSVCMVDLRRNEEYLLRFVIENITLDGNWAGQTEFNHRGYLRGYKSSPLSVSARTGRVRRVIVRNYGAHGVVPHRINDLGEGVEAFPLCVWTRDEGQEPEDGDLRPWVIEECEVSGFNGLYNGYTTAMIAVVRCNDAITPKWALDDPTRRLVWFRRNQVRGVPGDVGVIGLGAAGVGTNFTSKISFSDNVVLNGSAFNTDTGVMRHLDFTNSLFLDLISLGYLGAPYAGTPYMVDYAISGNSIRLRGLFTTFEYTDFQWANNERGGLVGRPDPGLILGRRAFPKAVGLTVGGIAQNIRLTDNWFTTRARDDFSNLNPVFPRDPTYLLVNRLPSKDPEKPNSPVIRRLDALDVDLNGNQLSSVPFDFRDFQAIKGGRHQRLTETSSSLMEVLRPLPAQLGFVATGAVERLGPIFGVRPRRVEWMGVAAGGAVEPRRGHTNFPDRILTGGIEVVLGVTTRGATDGNLKVPVRVAVQPTPVSGMKGTRPLANRAVFLEVLPGSRHPQRLKAVTGDDGVATFTYGVAPDANGLDYFRAWSDHGQGKPEVWDEYQDAWSTSQVAHGTTIGIVVVNDIADARNGNPANFRLIRSGRLDLPLTIALRFFAGPHAAESGRDFELLSPDSGGVSGRKNKVAQRVGSTIALPAGRREVTLLVKPLTGTRSGRVVTLGIQPGEGYGVGAPAMGEIAIFAP